jgi:hypothetical protein
MQSLYDEAFTREMGCTLKEWHRWLPQAIGEHPWQLEDHVANIALFSGRLIIRWEEGEPRVIALARMPRLIVSFTFTDLDAEQRYVFMKRFDLYMHRGGG